jgi:hypothetical protein
MNPRPHWTSTGTLVPAYIQYYKSFSPHKSHDLVSLTPSLHLIGQKTGIQHIDFPRPLLQDSLQRTTPIFCVIDLVNLMDYCSSSEFPKIRILALEKQDNKTQIRTKPKHRFLKIVVGRFQNL